MLRGKLKLQVHLNNKKTFKSAENMTTMTKDSSVAWTIFSFAAKSFILIFFGSLILFPFFYMISTALMSNAEAKDIFHAHVIPEHGLHWGNFVKAFEGGYWKALLITLIVTASSIVLKIILTLFMGYAFSYKNWRFKKLIWWFLLSILMVPEIALVVGQYKLTVQMGMQVGNATVVAMFLPFIASIFSAFMFRNAFESIPDRIKEAAIIDGASEMKYFWKVAVPMVTPTIWTVVILTAFAAWNSYMWPQLLAFGATEPKNVLGTWLFTTGKELDQNGGTIALLMNVRLAAAIMITLPMMIIYAVFRTRIMKAISRQGSAIKG